MEHVKSVRNCSLDFISDLPSNVIEYILMYLPLPDAVRTSILSRKWRYKWVTLQQLIFDPLVCQKSPRNRTLAKQKLVTTIYQVLLCHKGPILKFVLSNPNMESCSEINQWILFLSNHNILDFTLRIWRGQPHELPSHFYSFLQLRNLNLYSCVFKPPPTFKGFSRLTSLDFHYVVLATEIFGSFISSCPLLERLTLYGCTYFECLEIDAPNLKTLSFVGILKAICLKNTPRLATASIGLVRMSENVENLMEGETFNLIKVFGCLPLIERLGVSGYFLKFLGVGNVPMRLPVPLKHIKILNIAELCFARMEEISCALCLIRSSPNLQKLEISASSDINGLTEPVVEFLQERYFSSYSLIRLQKVKMQQISGMEFELKFIKFLLANSIMLKTMVIVPDKEKVTDGGLKILKELTQFCRASPNAEIIYCDPN